MKKKSINKLNVFCAMPWVHFHSGDHGIVKACCVSNIPLGNIRNQSFNEIWNGAKMEALREQFRSGVPDKRCGYCLNMEAAGGRSIRQETWDKFGKIMDVEAPRPIYFDIRFSNECNFKCRTCWHGASSTWYADAQQLGNVAGNTKVLHHITDFQQIISQIGPHLTHAKEIYLAGGEPLITPMHYQLVHWLIGKQATQVHLRYNTNLSTLQFQRDKILDLWQQFDQITVMVSIDETHELGAYIRWGMQWEKVKKNIQIVQKVPHITLQVAPTISLLNIFTLDAMITRLIERQLFDPTQFYFNVLERPSMYNIQLLSPAHKSQITQKLQSLTERYPAIKRGIEKIISYMHKRHRHQEWSSFQAYNTTLDRIRQEQLPNEFGEFEF